MDGLANRIQRGETLLADGAMGTMLLERGFELGACPELLNLTQPEILEEIASLYLDAGADILETNTFGASPAKLAQYDLEEKTEAINEAAVRVVRTVAGSRAYVAGSCGPSGKLLKPYGDTDPEELYDGFRRQMESLVAAGVDAIFVETMIDLSEASLAVRAARDAGPSLPIFASMTFEATPRGFHTVMGVNVDQAANGLREAGADVIGSNCGNGIEDMIEIAHAFRPSTDLPLIIQSNAGLPVSIDDATVYPETPAIMARGCNTLRKTGVQVIGGCCGTTPAHIRALREMIDASHETHDKH